MKRLTLAVLLFLFASVAGAQTTVVTGQILDPNNTIYANSFITANFWNPSAAVANWNGYPMTATTWTASTNSLGNFTLNLPDLNFISPATGTYYTFTIQYASGKPSFVYTSPSCPTSGCITGSTISITSALQAVSVPLCASGLYTASGCVSGGGGFPTSAQIGDITRWNVNGDSAWDATNIAQPKTFIYPEWGGNPTVTGVLAGTWASTGSHTSINPTATLGVGDQYSASASASTSTVIGETAGSNGSNSVEGMLAFYRFSNRIKIGNSTSVRYWMGLGCYNSSGTGGNTLGILGTTAYASDTPNKTTLGFRYSATTDAYWQAVAIVAGSSSGSQTTVSTGVAPDTVNPHLFEMAPNSTGTAINYLIDNVLVATITTNLPNPANGADTWGNVFWTGDNKNTATAISAIDYLMTISYK